MEVAKWDKRDKVKSKQITYVVNENGCHEITSHTLNRGGYGTLKIKKSSVLAHRYSYEMNIGEIPEGMKVCHSCDNRKCINPEHLFLGTQEDNMKDMREKGRRKNIAAVYGEIHGNSKLNEEKVKYIRKNMHMTSGQVSKIVGVSPSVVRRVRRRELWNHVE